ncbi:MAG: hypothetical protein HC809_13540 [Gammaproteobacteria bacterium]|nr:hypothetical protein [Gammaproteobacteria bacterium]
MPRPPLNRFVEVIWLLPRGIEAQYELALPTGTVELVIDLETTRSRSRHSAGEAKRPTSAVRSSAARIRAHS